MRLHLKNFRCYEDKIFEFGETGLTLLSGPSGVGKSTIMIAIHFALFGAGNKLPTHGKKACSVELIIDDLKIMRSKGPVRLVVNDIYEDDAGESIIQERFGKLFSSVSYIPQDLKDSFVAMTPANRLLFLEKFAFGDVDISEIKGKVKALTKNLSDEHIKMSGNLEFALKILQDTEKPEEVVFPIKCKRDQREKAIRNEEIKYKNCAVLIKKIEKEIRALELEKNATSLYKSLRDDKQRLVERIDEKISTLEKIVIDYVGDDDLAGYKSRLERFLGNRKFEMAKSRYAENLTKLEELKKSEISESNRQLLEFRKTLWETIPKEEIDDQIELCRNLVNQRRTRDKLEKELSTLEVGDDPSTELNTISSQLEVAKSRLEILKLQKEVLSCPHCSNKVKFSNNSLIKVDIETVDDSSSIENIKSDIDNFKRVEDKLRSRLSKYRATTKRRSDIQKELSTLEIIEENLDTLESELDDIRQYKSDNEKLEIRIEELDGAIKSGKFSKTIISLEKKSRDDLDEIQKLEKYSEVEEESINEESLRSRIAQETENKNEIKRKNEKMRDLERERTDCQKEILTLESDYNTKWLVLTTNIEDVILEKTQSILETEKNREMYNETLKKIEKYQDYEKAFENYKGLSKKVEEIQKHEIKARKRYASACLFRDKILETESIAIANMIENINSHSQLYLDHFFPDNPISVKLSAFKEGKTGEKPCINLEIDYKGIEHDLSMLSGGEMSRVILAFTLALAEIHNSPLILLDESTASLDQDLTSSVINGLKENFSNKLVVLIAHQVVQGVFDKVIKL
jgi:DNA repair exonuclease SbcCD ATPase subunit